MDELLLPQHRLHPRQFEHNRFVYPVLSRRSRGISVGINLNPDKICNFDCIYCQVDRRDESEQSFVELDRLLAELDVLLDWIKSGEIFEDSRFASVPEPLRRLNDIAFSGDGEPTTFRNFDEIVARVAGLKRRHELTSVRIVLITNASMFHRPIVQQGLRLLDENQGQIWAKLDAGTESYYRQIERTKIPFQQILDNLLLVARERPIVIQSIFMQVASEPPPEDEITAYIHRLNEILHSGGAIELVQVYTVARRPAESYVTPLGNADVDHIVKRVGAETGLRVEPFYG